MTHHGRLIKETMKAKGMKAAALSQSLNMSPQALNSLFKTATINEERLNEVSKALEVDVRSFHKQISLQNTPSDLNNNRTSLSITNQSKGIPYYEVDVFAGSPPLFSDQREVPTTYISFPGFQDCDFACRVSGDSMEDKIHAGDIIACKEINDRHILAYGDIHLIITKEHRFVKILRRGAQKGALILRSANKEYDDIDVDIDDILRIYLIKGIIKKTQI